MFNQERKATLETDLKCITKKDKTFQKQIWHLYQRKTRHTGKRSERYNQERQDTLETNKKEQKFGRRPDALEK